jgi:hypothetical protein
MPNIQEDSDCFVVVCEGDPKIVGSTETLEDAQNWVAELRAEHPEQVYRAVRATWDLVTYANDWSWTTICVMEAGKETELAVAGSPLVSTAYNDHPIKPVQSGPRRGSRRRLRPS